MIPNPHILALSTEDVEQLIEACKALRQSLGREGMQKLPPAALGLLALDDVLRPLLPRER